MKLLKSLVFALLKLDMAFQDHRRCDQRSKHCHDHGPGDGADKPPPGPPGQCSSVASAVPFLRAYNPKSKHHFYTADANEMTNYTSQLGFQQEGPPGKIFNTQQPGTIPLYRMWNLGLGDHLYTTSYEERTNRLQIGYAPEKIAGYIFKDNICGSVPLIRMFSITAQDHFFTSSEAEAINAGATLGYTREGVIGYLPQMLLH